VKRGASSVRGPKSSAKEKLSRRKQACARSDESEGTARRKLRKEAARKEAARNEAEREGKEASSKEEKRLKKLRQRL